MGSGHRGVETGRGQSGPLARLAVRWAHVAILTGVAVAQPLLDILGRHPTFFVAQDNTPTDILFFVAVVCLGLPSLIFAVETVLGMAGRRIARAAQFLVTALLAGTACLSVMRGVAAAPGGLLVVAAGIAGLGLAVAYARSSEFRAVTTWISPVVAVIPGLFLFASPASELLFPAAPDVAGAEHVDSAVPVVLVVFDELSTASVIDERGEIDADLFPSFAALANEAVWFRNASAVSDWTIIALPAILSGRRPLEGAARLLPTSGGYPENLFTLLAGAYEIRASESVTALCPRDIPGCEPPGAQGEGDAVGLWERFDDHLLVYLHVLLPRDLAESLPRIDHAWAGFLHGATQAPSDGNIGKELKLTDRALIDQAWAAKPLDGRAEKFQTFLSSIRAQPRNALYFVHALLPHAPWEYLPSGKQYLTGGNTGFLASGIWGDAEAEAVVGLQRYMLQLAFVDRLLGQLVARLKDVGLYDDTLLIVTADHGVSFRPGDFRRAATPTNIAEVAGVPLLVKLPRQRERRVSERPVEVIDIVPTIADVVGVELPWQLDGRSLLGEQGGSGRTRTLVRGAWSYQDNPALSMYRNTELEVPELSGRVLQSARRQRLLVSTGSGWEGLFATDDFSRLLGRPVRNLSVSTGNFATVLAGANLFGGIDPNAAVVPSFITGMLEDTSGAPPERVAIAVNGVIRSVSRVWRDPQPVFSAVVPASSFVAGKNEVRVFGVTGVPEKPRLLRTRGGGPVLAVDGALKPLELLDGVIGDKSNWAYAPLDQPVTVTLRPPWRYATARLHLYDADSRFYKLRVEGRVGGTWTLLVDHSDEGVSGLQVVPLPDTELEALRITGSYNSRQETNPANRFLHLYELELVDTDAAGNAATR